MGDEGRAGSFRPRGIQPLSCSDSIVKCCGWSLIQAAALTSIPSTNLIPEMTA